MSPASQRRLEVVLPLSIRALAEDDLVRAERLSRIAVSKAPEHAPALTSLARVIVG
jgi:hypothetical protein